MSHNVVMGPIPGFGAHSMQAAYLGGPDVDVTGAQETKTNTAANGVSVLTLDKSPTAGPQTGSVLRVLAGANSSGAAIEVVHSGTGYGVDIIAPIGKQLRAADSATDATTKLFYTSCRHYTNAEQDLAVFVANSSAAASTLTIGGGSGALNAATSVQIWTGATSTTVTGVQAARWDNAQRQIFTAQMRGPNGVVGTPTYSYANFTTHGHYAAANSVSTCVSGTEILRVSGGGVNIQVNPGNFSNPGISSILDPNSGIYWTAPDTVSIATGGVKAHSWNANRQNIAINGTALLPAYAFSSYPTHGWFASANHIEATVGGTLQLRIAGNGTGVAIGNGSAANPGLNARNDTNTGIYWQGADAFAVSTSGVLAHSWNASQQNIAISGSETLPAYAFAGSATTGMYYSSSALWFTVLGVDRVLYTSGGGGVIRVVGGTVSVPTYSLLSDSNTGVYFPAADTVGFATGGRAALVVANNAIVTRITTTAGDYFAFGSGSSNRGLVSDNDVYVTGKLEVDGAIYVDSTLIVVNSGSINIGSGTSANLSWRSAITRPTLYITGDATSRSIVMVDRANFANDFLTANYADPTLVVYSATAAATATDEWASVSHDKTSAVFGSGTSRMDFTLAGTALLSYNSSQWIFTGAPIPNASNTHNLGLTGSRWITVYSGRTNLAQVAATSGTPPSSFLLTEPAHTGLTLSAEYTAVNFDMSSTIQFATGPIATQRAMRIQAPTYNAVAASTITNAATVSISGPPIATGFVTITNAAALLIESGQVHLADGSAALPGWAFASDPDTGFYKVAANDMALVCAGGLKMRFQAGAVFHYTNTVPFTTSAYTFGSTALRWATVFTDDITVTNSVTIDSGGTSDPVLMANTVDPSAAAGIAAPEGSILMRFVAAAGEVWFKSGAADTAWTEVGAGGGGSLDAGYDISPIITVDAGAVVMNQSTATNTLELNQSGAGVAARIALTTSATAQAMVVTESAVARTNSLVKITRDVGVTGTVAHLMELVNNGAADGINMVVSGTGTLAKGLVITESAVARSQPLVSITRSGTATGFALEVSGGDSKFDDIDTSGGERRTFMMLISNISSSFISTLGPGSVVGADEEGWIICSRAGSCVEFSACMNANMATGNIDLYVEKSTDNGATFSALWGSATTGIIVFNSTPDTLRAAQVTQAKDTSTFAAGDILRVRSDNTGSPTGPTAGAVSFTIEM